MDHPGIKHRLEQFDIKHGMNEAVKSADGSFWLFPDGARRDVNPYGLLQEPPYPASEYELTRTRRTPEQAKQQLLERQQEYHATRLARLTDEFHNLKQRMIGGHFNDEQLDELNKLKKAVHVCRHQLQQVEQEIEDSRPRNIARRLAADVEQARQQRVDVVKDINI